MLDIGFVRDHPDVVKRSVEQRHLTVDVDRLLELDRQRREHQGKLDDLNRERKAIAQQVRADGPTEDLLQQGQTLKKQAQGEEDVWRPFEEEFVSLFEALPNILADDVPVGKSEEDNKVLRTVGELPSFLFTPRTHWELGEALGVIDNERAARVSGSRFTYLKGELAMLEFALVQHALSVLTNPTLLAEIISSANLSVAPTPFVPVIPPALIRADVFQKMARLEPRDERYYIPSDDLYLIGSAEHTLGPLHLNETLREPDLPIRYVGFSPSFRREAGSYGKDVHGILRMHQFDKVEMESFTLPEQGIAEQDFFVAIQEYLMQSLQLPYRVVLLCTGDMGAPDARQIDLETWLPGQDMYRETHSADYMTDYQSRRLRTKVKREDGRLEYVHMNDATVFAIGRTLITLMENYQREDGSVHIPEALHAYLPFTDIRRPPSSS